MCSIWPMDDIRKAVPLDFHLLWRYVHISSVWGKYVIYLSFVLDSICRWLTDWIDGSKAMNSRGVMSSWGYVPHFHGEGVVGALWRVNEEAVANRSHFGGPAKIRAGFAYAREIHSPPSSSRSKPSDHDPRRNRRGSLERHNEVNTGRPEASSIPNWSSLSRLSHRY